MSAKKNNKSIAYKDRDPLKTINLIKSTLKKIGIKLVEETYDSGIPNVYSLSVYIKGAPQYSTNGKGTTLVYARASAYAEFIERLSNMSIFPKNFFRTKTFYDMKPIKLSDYFDSPFLGEKRNKVKYLRNLIHVYNDDDENCFAVPYQRMDNKKKETVLIPYPFGIFYSSNGMASGNSFYEMSVQAISEIFERVALLKILTRKKEALVYDNKKVVKIFPKLKPIINHLLKRGYQIKIYDCSIGQNLPVFAVLVFDETRENYSVSFGSHPNAEFAITRCFTEMFQGMENHQLKNNIYRIENKFSNFNLQQILHNGYGSFDHSFLYTEKPSHNYALLTKHYKSNKEMYEHYLALCKKYHYPLYYHDASYLGLSAGQYIIPGVSINYYPDDFELRFFETKATYSPLLDDFLNLKKADQLYLLELYDFTYRAFQTEDDDGIFTSTYYSDHSTNYVLFFAFANAICKNFKRANAYLDLAYQYLAYAHMKPTALNKIEKIIASRDVNKIKQAFIAAKFKRVPYLDKFDYYPYLEKIKAIQRAYYQKRSSR